MEKNNGNTCSSKHHPFTNLNRSPHLLQSKSKHTTPPADPHMQAQKTRLTLLNNPSKSKSFCKAEETTVTSRIHRKKLCRESRDDSNKHLLLGSSCRQSNITDHVPRRSRSASSSPSAWALSPGRSLQLQHPQSPLPRSLDSVSTKSPIISAKSKRDSSSSSTGVSGVLKYLGKKIRRVPRGLQEEEYHRFRVVHNTLMQWRFVNARAGVSMTAVKRAAEKKLFNVWLKLSIMKTVVAERRIQLQRLSKQIKLWYILGSELYLLKEWSRLESKNREAVGSLARQLSAVSRCLPLDRGATKAGVTSLLDSMVLATRVIESIEPNITNIEAQVERLCYMLTELSVIVGEQKDYAIMLQKSLATVASLVAKETSLRLHSMQLDEESRRFNSSTLTQLALEL